MSPISSTRTSASIRTSSCRDAIDVMAPDAKGKFGDELRKAVQHARLRRTSAHRSGLLEHPLARTMTSEAYRFAQEAGGYDTTQLNWNAADTVVLNSDFGPDVEYSRLADGYEEVPRQLAQRFIDQGGELHLQHGVRSSIRHARGRYPRSGARGRERSHRPQAGGACAARYPRDAPPLARAPRPVGARARRRRFPTATDRPSRPSRCSRRSSRITSPGGRSSASRRAASVDRPSSRQVYYWASTPKKSSVLLARMTILSTSASGRASPLIPAATGSSSTTCPRAARGAFSRARSTTAGWRGKPPPALLDEIHRQLVEMHDVPSAPAPTLAVYHDWIDDPFGGGVNFWNIGVKSWRVIPKMAHPVPRFPCTSAGRPIRTPRDGSKARSAPPSSC